MSDEKGSGLRSSDPQKMISVLALSAFILAIVASIAMLLFIMSPSIPLGYTQLIAVTLSLLLGITALACKRRKLELISWATLAVAGVVMSGAVLAMNILTVISYSPEGEARTRCTMNLYVLQAAMSKYCDEHGDRFPPANRWTDALSKYVQDPSVFHCPGLAGTESSYAMNSRLGNAPRSMAQPDTVLLFDSVPGRNVAGGPELLPRPARHRWHVVILVDGRTRRLYDSNEIGRLNWGAGAIRQDGRP